MHSYLIGQSTSESTSPPALHVLLEVQQASIIKQFQQIQAEFKLKLTQTLQDTIKDTVTEALRSQTPLTVPRVYHEIPDTPRTSLDTGKGKYREFSIPTKLGSADRSESSRKHIKIEPPTSGTHLSGVGTSLSLSDHSTHPLDPFSPGQTPIPSLPATSIPLPRPAETEEEGEQEKMEQFAELVGHAFFGPPSRGY
jgi:hypothetical protein